MRAVGPNAFGDTAPALRGGAKLREWLLLVGFALIVVAGVLTVALPELSKEPAGDASARPDAGARAK